MVQAFMNLSEAGCITKWKARLAGYKKMLWASLLMGYASLVSAVLSEMPMALPNGCTIYIQQLDPNLATTVFRAEGACNNGLAEGFWSLGLESGQDRVFLYRSFIQGKLEGVSFGLGPKFAMILVTDPTLNRTYMREHLSRDGPPAEMERFLFIIDGANAVARRLKKPAGDAAKMKALVRKWKQGDDSVIDQWFTGPGTSPSAAIAIRDSAGADDPKTVGRGMRGG